MHADCFPLTYDVNGFKFRVNRQHFIFGFFQQISYVLIIFLLFFLLFSLVWGESQVCFFFFLKKACSNKFDVSKEKKNILFFNSLILLHNKFVTTSFLQNEWNTLGCLINQGKGVVVTCLFESNQRKGWIRQVETIKTKRNMEAKETI